MDNAETIYSLIDPIIINDIKIYSVTMSDSEFKFYVEYLSHRLLVFRSIPSGFFSCITLSSSETSFQNTSFVFDSIEKIIKAQNLPDLV